MDTLNILMVRERPGNSPDCFAMYACRGKEAHCAAQLKSNPSKPCSSCVRGDDEETIEQLVKRLERGNG